MKIGIAFDLAPAAPAPGGPDDRFEEFDKPETVEALAGVLRGEGHDVVLLGDGREFLARVLDEPVDFVWNLAEGEGVGRCRESRVPAVLEMLGVPYTGSDALTLAASLDKPVAKRLVAGVAAVALGRAFAPGAAFVEVEAAVGRDCGPGPWIVKPAFEGSSKGIRARCLVGTPAEAAGLVVELGRDYEQPVLVEEFIHGEEVTVGLVGNGPTLEVLGAMRILPKRPEDPFIYTIESKRDWDARITYETPARLAPEVGARLREAAVASFEALGCRDLARIDFRVRGVVPYFLEANPLPGLAPDWSDLVILSRGVGLSYADLVRRVLDASLRRVGLAPAVARRTAG